MYTRRRKRLKRQAIRKFGKKAKDKIQQFVEDELKNHIKNKEIREKQLEKEKKHSTYSVSLFIYNQREKENKTKKNKREKIILQLTKNCFILYREEQIWI